MAPFVAVIVEVVYSYKFTITNLLQCNLTFLRHRV